MGCKTGHSCRVKTDRLASHVFSGQVVLVGLFSGFFIADDEEASMCYLLRIEASMCYLLRIARMAPDALSHPLKG